MEVPGALVPGGQFDASDGRRIPLFDLAHDVCADPPVLQVRIDDELSDKEGVILEGAPDASYDPSAHLNFVDRSLFELPLDIFQRLGERRQAEVLVDQRLAMERSLLQLQYHLKIVCCRRCELES